MNKMTPRERMLCVRRGDKPDIIPLNTGPHNDFLCHYYGISVEEYLSNAAFCAECNIKFVEEFKIDSSVVTPGYILYGCGPEIGTEWKFVDGHFPGFINGPLQSETDLDKIVVPDNPGGYFKHYLDILTRVNQETGDTYVLVGHILGTLAIACFLRGIETALMDTMTNVAFFKKYIQRCTELSLFFGRQVIATGINSPIINEIFLTPEMIHPDAFHELIAPHDQQVLETLGRDKIGRILGSEAMGQYKNRESQKKGATLYRAVFSPDDLMNTFKHTVDLLPLAAPVSIAVSSNAFNGWDINDILSFYKEGIDFTIKEKNKCPIITIPSLMPLDPDHARALAEKLRAIDEFRNNYF